MRTLVNIAKYLLWLALVCVGLLAFFVLCGEESEPISTLEFFAWKFGAIGVIALCVKIGRFALHHNALPDSVIKDLTDERA